MRFERVPDHNDFYVYVHFDNRLGHVLAYDWRRISCDSAINRRQGCLVLIFLSITSRRRKVSILRFLKSTRRACSRLINRQALNSFANTCSLRNHRSVNIMLKIVTSLDNAFLQCLSTIEFERKTHILFYLTFTNIYTYILHIHV